MENATMTYQGDPQDPRRSQDYIDDRRMNFGPIIGGLASLGVLALLIFSFVGAERTTTGDPVTPRSSGATAPTTAPANKPAPPPAPATKPQ
jgi:hypothetical protein